MIKSRNYTIFAVSTKQGELLGSGQTHPHIFWRKADAKKWIKEAEKRLPFVKDREELKWLVVPISFTL